MARLRLWTPLGILLFSFVIYSVISLAFLWHCTGVSIELVSLLFLFFFFFSCFCQTILRHLRASYIIVVSRLLYLFVQNCQKGSKGAFISSNCLPLIFSPIPEEMTYC
jgi:hypothetical protein